MILAGNLTVFSNILAEMLHQNFGEHVCTLSSSTAMIDSSKKITRNKKTNPCLRLLV